MPTDESLPPRTILHEPPRSEWRALIEQGYRRCHALTGKCPEIAAKARNEIFAVSARHEELVQATAKAHAISIAPLAAKIGTGPVVASGHQPTIPHWGLMEKLLQLDSLTHEGCTALNVILDTDVAGHADLTLPKALGDDYAIGHATVMQGGAVYRERVVADAAHLRDAKREIVASMQGLNAPAVVERVEAFWMYLEQLSGVPQSIARTILLRLYFPHLRHHELALSELCRGESFGEFAKLCIDDAARLHHTYNSVLDAYRAAHKIENRANPFPNLSELDGLLEMPLWGIHDANRVRLMVERASGTVVIQEDRGPRLALPANALIVPRGALVTLFLRLCCGELFIHGTGGARYDGATEQLARAWLGVELAHFVVASATAYLFSEQVRALDQRERLHGEIRAATTHPERLIGRGLISKEAEQRLREFGRERERLISEQRARQAQGIPVGDVGKALAQVSGAIRSLLTGEISESGAVSPATASAWRCREYPFFLFQEPKNATAAA